MTDHLCFPTARLQTGEASAYTFTIIPQGTKATAHMPSFLFQSQGGDGGGTAAHADRASLFMKHETCG